MTAESIVESAGCAGSESLLSSEVSAFQLCAMKPLPPEAS